MMRLPLPSHKRSENGFSLIELLAVIAIISLLASMALPALQGVKARNLVKGGNLVADMVQQARQNSMSRCVCTALVMVSSKQPDWNNRLFILVELPPGGSAWKPVTPWFELPEGVIVDPSASSGFAQSLPALPLALNLPPRQGKTVLPSECAYQVFTPAGGLSDTVSNLNEPRVLRLVQGWLSNGQVREISRGNYYDLIINRFTGIARIDRP